MAAKLRCDICRSSKGPLWQFIIKIGGRKHTRCRKHLDNKRAARDLKARREA